MNGKSGSPAAATVWGDGKQMSDLHPRGLQGSLQRGEEGERPAPPEREEGGGGRRGEARRGRRSAA